LNGPLKLKWIFQTSSKQSPLPHVLVSHDFNRDFILYSFASEEIIVAILT
jgi:hypothetical protein